MSSSLRRSIKDILLLASALSFLIPTACRRDSTPSPSAVAAMKFIPGGSFSMGEKKIAEPIHPVRVAPFYMDSVPVTQRDYRNLMGANPSRFTGDSLRPVETVTWFDAALYCNARSKAFGLDTVYAYSALKRRTRGACDSMGDLIIHYERKGFRLPTEAEYEYAERAGSKTEFYWGDGISGDHCWYYGNSGNSTHTVAQKLPNAFGLYDMAGNVLEWCNDWFAPYDGKDAKNPVGPAGGEYRVLRGSSWYIYYLIIHASAYRYYLEPAPKLIPPRDYYGFRCVLPAG